MTAPRRWQDWDKAARAVGLRVAGGLVPAPHGSLPPDTKAILMLSPDEPGFWPVFRRSAEAQDGARDPMDRWSRRVVTALAQDGGAVAIFPFGGPPYAPFFDWAVATGRVYSSPVTLLVDGVSGLNVSFRGAIALAEPIALPRPLPSPCDTCAEKPCLRACPVAALTGKGYDVAACRDYLATPESQRCRETGCQVRNACPVSKKSGRIAAQAAFHMSYFL